MLGALVEIPVAVLVAVEVAILFAGVVARYVLHRPLVWSDELASILFLWLAMLGAAVAFRRNEHMRMTALVARAAPSGRAFLDVVATGAALAFLALVAWPALDYAIEESDITTPALGISNAWRAAALPVGIGLMVGFALLRLAKAGSPRRVVGALGVVAVIAGAFWLAQPVFRQLGNLNLVIFFVGVVAASVFAGIPIAFAFGLAVFGYLALSTRTPLLVLVGRMDEGMSHLILLSVPLFVFLGLLIEMTGMARAMVAFLASLLGHVRGGLHYVPRGRDVPRLRHLGRQGGRHGGGRARPLPRDAGARREARRPRRAPRRHGRADGDGAALARPHHDRLGHGRLDRRAVHRRPAPR